MTITSLDGQLELTVLVDGNPINPILLNRSAENTKGIIELVYNQPFEVRWGLASRPFQDEREGSSRPTAVAHAEGNTDLTVLAYLDELLVYQVVTRHINGIPKDHTFIDLRPTHCKARFEIDFWREPLNTKVSAPGRRRTLPADPSTYGYTKVHTFDLLYQTDKHGQNGATCDCAGFEVEERKEGQRRLAEQRERQEEERRETQRQEAERRQQDVLREEQRARREQEIAQGLNERERKLLQRERAVERRERAVGQQERERGIVHSAADESEEDRKPRIVGSQDDGSDSRLKGRLAKVEQELASLRSMIRRRDSRSTSPSEPSSPRKRPR
jgi:hypothetical protein